MTVTKTYTIGELARAGGVTTRTIRYYVSEGLLEPPEKEGRAAAYTAEHLARLELIKMLKEEFLPLQEIASLLRGLDTQAVFELLKEKQKTERPASNSAKEYLEALLNPPAAAERPTLMRHRLLTKKEGEEEPPLARAAPPSGLGLEAGAPRVAAKTKPAETDTAAAELIVGRVEPGPTPGQTKPASSVTQWQRIEITPGIELHVRGGIEKTSIWSKVEQLIKVARQLFSLM